MHLSVQNVQGYHHIHELWTFKNIFNAVGTKDCLMLCAYYTGESSVEVKTEADSNDITEHPHDDKPTPCTVCDKRFKG